MTDLTTMHLKCLLEQATPGPWEAEGDAYPDYITSKHGKVLWNTDLAFDWNQEEKDVYLAAAAPQLAQEVIRLRGEVKGLITAMEDKATTGESQSPAIIAGYLKEIVLGEVNE